MNKLEKLKLKKAMLIGMVGTTIGASTLTGCGNKAQTSNETAASETTTEQNIGTQDLSKYSHFDRYLENGYENGEVVNFYPADKTLLLFNKKTQSCKKYLLVKYTTVSDGGLKYLDTTNHYMQYSDTNIYEDREIELYDIDSKKLIAYLNHIGVDDYIEKKYYKNLIDENYQVPLEDLENFTGEKPKGAYSLDEINNLEIELGNLIFNKEKAKTK